MRLKQAGLPRPDGVYMVSAANGFGVREMLTSLKQKMGFRADLWVVGAQNGGRPPALPHLPPPPTTHPDAHTQPPTCSGRQ